MPSYRLCRIKNKSKNKSNGDINKSFRYFAGIRKKSNATKIKLRNLVTDDIDVKNINKEFPISMYSHRRSSSAPPENRVFKIMEPIAPVYKEKVTELSDLLNNMAI